MSKQNVLKELNHWLDRFKISHYLNKKVEELSKGNQQKIKFLSAVIQKPILLILDEPLYGLDPINVEMLKGAVMDLKDSGTSIVFSSHQKDHVEKLCENVCILQQGKAVVKGNLREIKRSYGKKKLIIHMDESMDFIKNIDGVVGFQSTVNGCELQISDEQVSQEILQQLQGKGIVRKFEIEEPSLNDIFIEKVGASYE